MTRADFTFVENRTTKPLGIGRTTLHPDINRVSTTQLEDVLERGLLGAQYFEPGGGLVLPQHSAGRDKSPVIVVHNASPRALRLGNGAELAARATHAMPAEWWAKHVLSVADLRRAADAQLLRVVEGDVADVADETVAEAG